MSKPSMLVFAGVNGAGKSTLTRNMVDQAYYVIDPDQIAKDSRISSFDAGKETIKRVDYCINNKISFSLETTLSGNLIFRQMKKAKDSGFSVTMLFVGLSSVEAHLERIAERVLKGGHNIPEEDVRRRYPRTMKNLSKSLDYVETVHVFDNSTELLLKLTIMKGKVIPQEKNLPNWIVQILSKPNLLGDFNYFV